MLTVTLKSQRCRCYCIRVIHQSDTVASVPPEKLPLNSPGGLSFALPLLDMQLKDYSSEPAMPWPREIYQLHWISASKPPGRLSRPKLWHRDGASKSMMNLPLYDTWVSNHCHLDNLASKAWNLKCCPATFLTLSKPSKPSVLPHSTLDHLAIP